MPRESDTKRSSQLVPTSPASAPVFAPGVELHEAVVGAFTRAVEDACAAAEGSPGDLDEAVHEVRRALRRARAVLALVAAELPAERADALMDALQETRRGLSLARDHAVAPGAMAMLSLDDATRAAAERLGATAKTRAPERHVVIARLHEGARRVEPTPRELAEALPREITWEALMEGLADTYRAARRALRKAKRSRRALHRWRRRTKELNLQLKLFAAGAGARTLRVAAPFSRMSDELGELADLLMLGRFVADHRASLERATLAAIREATAGALRRRSRKARQHGADVFDAGARRFTRRVSEAVRRDVAQREQSESATPAER